MLGWNVLTRILILNTSKIGCTLKHWKCPACFGLKQPSVLIYGCICEYNCKLLSPVRERKHKRKKKYNIKQPSQNKDTE